MTTKSHPTDLSSRCCAREAGAEMDSMLAMLRLFAQSFKTRFCRTKFDDLLISYVAKSRLLCLAHWFIFAVYSDPSLEGDCEVGVLFLSIVAFSVLRPYFTSLRSSMPFFAYMA
jgi:hypothetical protein